MIKLISKGKGKKLDVDDLKSFEDRFKSFSHTGCCPDEPLGCSGLRGRIEPCGYWEPLESPNQDSTSE